MSANDFMWEDPLMKAILENDLKSVKEYFKKQKYAQNEIMESVELLRPDGRGYFTIPKFCFVEFPKMYEFLSGKLPSNPWFMQVNSIYHLQLVNSTVLDVVPQHVQENERATHQLEGLGVDMVSRWINALMNVEYGCIILGKQERKFILNEDDDKAEDKHEEET